MNVVPRAVVVIGQGQVITAIVLRGLGWHVDLVADVEEGARLACETGALIVFVRITSSRLRSMRRPAISDEINLVAIVDSAEDTPLPRFDASIEVNDVGSLAAYVRSVAPTDRAIEVAVPRRNSEIVPVVAQVELDDVGAAE